MIAEIIVTLLQMIAEGAIVDAGYMLVTHSGPDARYFALAKCGHINGVVLADGHSIFVSRDVRLIVEPVELLRNRAIEDVARSWVTT